MNTPALPEETAVFEEFSGSVAMEPLTEAESVPRNASAAQEEWETAYRVLFESNPNPIWIFDLETLRFLHVNKAAIQHYGYSQDEFLSMTVKDIRPAEGVPSLLKSVEQEVKNYARYGVWRHRKRSGEIIEVEVTVQDFPFQGKTARLTMVQDITEHRRIERALQQSEQEQRQLAEHLEMERERLAEAQVIAKVGSWDLNLTTNVLFWSEETYRIFGVDLFTFEPSYETFLERVHPEDRAMVHKAYQESVANRALYAIDHRIIMADGSIKIVHERGKTEYDASGRPIRFIGMVQDITAQKETELKLKRSLDLLRAVTEGTTDAIFAKDTQGRYLMINTSGARLVGKTPEEILGKDDTDLFSPETACQTIEIDRQVMATGETCERESVGVAGGKTRTYQSTKGPLRDHNGNIIGVVGISRDITEKKQAEQTLHHILDGAHCLLWQAEVEETGKEWLQWNIQFASEQAAQRVLPLQLTAGRSYAESWFSARMAEDKERSSNYGTQEIRAGRSYQQEFRCHSKKGELHWFAENVHVETISEGQWRCTGVCTDITERKLAEEATRAMTRGAQCLLWYAVVEEQPHGFEWYTEIPDEETAKQFFPVKQPPGMSYPAALAQSRLPEDHPLMDARSTEALRSGKQGYTQQFRCLHADGEWRWLNETVHIEAQTPGRWHLVGVCTDITEQKKAEEERDRFFTLSLDLLCVIDPNGHFVRLNPAFETVLGYTRAELMARPLLDFVHPDDREATIAEIEKLNAGARTLHFENRYLCRDGSYRWIAWTSIAFQGFRYAVGHDITQIKEAKAALRIVNEELEARILDRTAQIMEANAQLIQAKLEADRANQAKSEFLSRMSHELRTPLNAILGFGQILDKEALTLLQQESVQYILKGGRHLLDLINEILDLARVEAGYINLSLESLSLTELVSESCALARPLATERHISLDIDAVTFGDNHVLADRQRLKQVLINLLSNAIKYNRAEGNVRLYGVPRPDNRLAIAVQDTGPGISVEDQQRLFVPFERLSASLSGVEGTGLGLVMAQRLVVAMGGLLTLESLPGVGTTFFIELPLVPSPVEILADLPIGVYEPKPDLLEGAKATILSIEDNLSNVRLLEVLLRSRPGTTLLTAMQGTIGLDLARQHEPDLILLDLNLPDLSGIEVLARLQRSALTRDIPVVILSADATPSQIERLKSAGAHGYLTKPLDVAEFLHTLETILPTGAAESPPIEELNI